MKSLLLCCGVIACLAATCWGARKAEPAQAAGNPEQKFVVVHSGRFIAGTLTLTNAEANCSIETASGAASMQCRPAGVSAKNSYHYNSALIVDSNGTGYIIACENSLVARWCKEFEARTMIVGDMANSNLAIADGGKSHNYVVLTSSYVGLAAAGLPAQPAPASTPVAAPSRSAGAPASEPSASQPLASQPVGRTLKDEKALSDSSAACVSSAGACVSFLSDPPGADIYVDDKFVGNTPSVITLAAGSHEIRMEAANRKPWTRTLETSAGSKITVRGTFEAPATDK